MVKKIFSQIRVFLCQILMIWLHMWFNPWLNVFLLQCMQGLNLYETKSRTFYCLNEKWVKNNVRWLYSSCSLLQFSCMDQRTGDSSRNMSMEELLYSAETATITVWTPPSMQRKHGHTKMTNYYWNVSIVS